MTRFLSALAALALFTAPASAQDVTQGMLDNGMEVVVIEDTRAPVVVHMVWYRAGGADEPPGKSGIAHFLEHLMFKATDTLASGEFSEIVNQIGGSDNAFTAHDYTAYFQRVASDRLGQMMEMEADRMVNIRITEDDVLTERDVILEERAMRYDNSPGALLSEQMTAALHLNHPYGVPNIGWGHEMAQLELEDAMDFYHAHYAPNNAILIVAGDVSFDEVMEMAAAHYGPIPANPEIKPRARPTEPPQLAPRRMTLTDPRVGQPWIVRDYLAPERNPGAQEEAAALVYLSEILGGNPATSVFGQALEFDQIIAVSTFAYYSAMSLDVSSIRIGVVPVAGVSLAEAEAAMDAVLADFFETGIDPDQFARIKARIEANDIYARDSMRGLANRYGTGLATSLTIEDIEAWPDILNAVTQEDVMAIAAKVFDLNASVTGWLMAPEMDEETAQ